GVNGT
ncbi:alpha amylase, catalytic domain protein, partial [Vibrio harveyi]